MQTINDTAARNQLAGLMEAASRDREPIAITRNGAGKVVLLAVEEYEAMEAALHLLPTRSDAYQIQQSLNDFAAGKIQTGALCNYMAAKRVEELPLLAGKRPGKRP